jgi:hypothetical protein
MTDNRVAKGEAQEAIPISQRYFLEAIFRFAAKLSKR